MFTLYFSYRREEINHGTHNSINDYVLIMEGNAWSKSSLIFLELRRGESSGKIKRKEWLQGYSGIIIIPPNHFSEQPPPLISVLK